MKHVIIILPLVFIFQHSISQNVGIGTTTPFVKLDVRNGSINTDSVYRITTQTVLSVAGDNNLMIGRFAGLVNTGSFNTFAGHNAGLTNSSGSFNSFFGRFAGSANTSGESNSFFGEDVGFGNITGSENSFFGRFAGFANTDASFNSFFGSSAGQSNTIGTHNSFFGRNAGRSNGFGSSNSFFGEGTGYNNLSGSENSFFGRTAGFNSTTGVNNSFFGLSAGYNDSIGSSNSFVGRNAGFNTGSGNNNSFLGEGAGYLNTFGSENVFAGRTSGFNNSTGNSNTAAGFDALSVNTTGSNNTAIGRNANVSSGVLSNATAIGSNAIVNASNKIRLGNAAVTVIEGQVAYTFPSDDRFKINVTETVKGLDFIMKLRPVIYNFQARRYEAFLLKDKAAETAFASYNYDASESIRQSGFIAQEVEKAANETGYDFNGVIIPKTNRETYSLAYSQFVVPLVKAMQEQQEMINVLKTELELIKTQTRDQQKRYELLLKRIETAETKN